jgi:hypothetical protein
MTTSTYNDPFGLLRNKKAAELAAGAFTSLTAIPPAQRSRYSSPAADATIELGLGYVQAVLAVLFGVVTTFSYDAPGSAGRVAMRSTGGSTLYTFSWSEERERLLLGGFIHGGHPTYQVAVAGLCQAIAAYRCGATARYDEVITAWYDLIRAMDRVYPRLSVEVPWDKRAIEAACHHAEIRPLIVSMCDVLRVALRYQLPTNTIREVGISEAQVLSRSDQGSRLRLPGTVLIDPYGMDTAPEGATPAPPPAAEARRTTRASAAKPAAAAAPPLAPPASPATPPVPSASPSPARPIAVSPMPTPAPREAAPSTPPAAAPASPSIPTPSPTASRLHGPHLGRIKRALERGGPVMLIGPTATGKTTQAKDAAAQLGMGFELVVLDEGWDAAELFGGYARAGAKGDWRFMPGPITRWAERISLGETVMLIIDELARGHKSVVSAVMRIMNAYTAADLTRMRITVPKGEDGPFYLVDVTATKQRIPVPCGKARIVATANQGDGYTGINLGDPAFRRRWSGGWLQLRGYEADVTRSILCDQLALPHGAQLITRMQAVALQVAEYQRREEALIATLDLATLITWGQATLRLVQSGVDIRQAFIESAVDVWIDRLVPLKGAELDPEIERTLHGYVAANTPSTL